MQRAMEFSGDFRNMKMIIDFARDNRRVPQIVWCIIQLVLQLGVPPRDHDEAKILHSETHKYRKPHQGARQIQFKHL